MDNENDYVLIEGDFVTQGSSCSSYDGRGHSSSKDSFKNRVKQENLLNRENKLRNYTLFKIFNELNI